jgi:translation initiation factor IF-2
LKVQDLAKELNMPINALIKFMLEMNIRAKTRTSKLDPATATSIKKALEKKNAAENIPQEEIEEKDLTLPLQNLTVSLLAQKLEISLAEIMKAFLKKGLLANLNSEIDEETAIEIAQEFKTNLTFEKKTVDLKVKNELGKIEEEELDGNLDDLEERPPIVTIMGHVDHGKTLLLDAIRESNIIGKEAGGITQHIGAYQVTIKDKKITFLDTPGHEAFTTLRARGAQVTDIAILVVAAEEGLKPQTLEAINHAKAANVPIIVAINKIDKPEANIEQCKQQLANYDLVSEDWGGKTIIVPVSAKNKTGIDDLLEMILLVSEMLELKARKKGLAKGVVVESRLSRKKGPIATILVKSGTLKIGDYFVIGAKYGKVRSLLNNMGSVIKKVEPGTPAELLGISQVPGPGDILEVYKTEKEAKIIAEKRHLQEKSTNTKQLSSISLETLSQQIEDGQINNLNIIIKADVNGSLEAIQGSIEQIPAKEVNIKILHSATGQISENDVMLAKASGALIIGFGVPINPLASKLAEEESINIKSYKIIYEIIDDIKKVVDGMFKIEYEEVEIGKAEIRKIFSYSKIGKIAGSYVTEGKIIKNTKAQIIREGKEVETSTIVSLKRFKDDVKEVASNFECGIVLENANLVQEGDTLVCIETREKKR